MPIKDQADRSQSAVGDKRSLGSVLLAGFASSDVGGGSAFDVIAMRRGTVSAGVEKAVFESPVLRQVVPAVVLLLPALVAERAYRCRGKHFGIERGDPEPFMFGGCRREFSPAVMILCQRLFGTYDANRERIVHGKRQSIGIP